jgi:large subunit ribosomal protein L29
VKGLNAKDLRGNDPTELRSTLRKLEEDLFKNRLKKNTNQLENTMLIRKARRDIARVNTVLTERLRREATSSEAMSSEATSKGAAAKENAK